jgi:hypothetical protein
VAAVALWLVTASAGTGGEDARILRGPYLQRLLDTSVEVIWVTDGPALGAVSFAAPGGPERTVAEDTPALKHVIELTGLEPATVYTYRVEGGEPFLAAKSFRFRTAPRRGEGELRAVVIGDSGGVTPEQRAVAALIRGLEPDIFLHTGDLDYADDPQLSVFEPYAEILPEACIFPVRGNHDIHFAWDDFFHTPECEAGRDAVCYAFDWGPAHFVAFDSNGSALAGGEQVQILESRLREARQAGVRWLIVYTHAPVYTIGGYARDEAVAAMATLVKPLFDQYRVDLFLSGHDHNYQRTHPVRGDVVVDAWQDPAFSSPRGTVYVVTGGGGHFQPYFRDPQADPRFTRVFEPVHHAVELLISESRIAVRAVRPDGQEIDRFTIDKQPAPPFRWRRGDANVDASTDLADAVAVLSYLFLGRPLECPQPADTDSSGTLNIADAVFLLNFLFLGGAGLAPPFPACGTIEGEDGAWCTGAPCPM